MGGGDDWYVHIEGVVMVRTNTLTTWVALKKYMTSHNNQIERRAGGGQHGEWGRWMKQGKRAADDTARVT